MREMVNVDTPLQLACKARDEGLLRIEGNYQQDALRRFKVTIACMHHH
jgi:hypothetical protein